MIDFHHLKVQRNLNTIHIKNLLNKPMSLLNKSQTSMHNFNTSLHKIIATTSHNHLHPNQTAIPLNKSTQHASRVSSYVTKPKMSFLIESIQKFSFNCSFLKQKIPFTENTKTYERSHSSTQPKTNNIYLNLNDTH